MNVKSLSIIDRLRIFQARGQAVVLDSDLAGIYGVATGALNQAINRNRSRFPDDFSFFLTEGEFEALMSQIVISKGRGGRRKLPRVFTEHGAIMASTVLNSPRAVANKEKFLLIFNHFIADRTIVAAFRRHYAQVKGSLEAPPPLEP